MFREPTIPGVSRVYGLLAEAFQASDVGSIPIARSINLVDSVALALATNENEAI